VASTKAFTSQLVALYLLALRLAQVRGVLSAEDWKPA
jgi:glucosamine--fructose-6-phosphate aminotransferase (isomerizing)